MIVYYDKNMFISGILDEKKHKVDCDCSSCLWGAYEAGNVADDLDITDYNKKRYAELIGEMNKAIIKIIKKR